MRARKMSKRTRAPNCTHLDMDRVYGDHVCAFCGHTPSVGFLYECKQDCDVQPLRDLIIENSYDENGVIAFKSDQRLQLEKLGLSENIILTAEQGNYSAVQLEKLKTQKKDMRQIISDTLQATHINHAVMRLAALASMPSKHDGNLESSMKSLAAQPGCHLKACHTCRPYYRDRTYISFQAVLNAEFRPVTRDDIDALPTKSAQIIKKIGNITHCFPSFSTSLPASTSLATSVDAPPTATTNTSSASDLTFKTTQTDLEAISAQRRPRRRFYKIGHRNSSDIARDLSRQPTRDRLSRQGLRAAFQGIFCSNRDSSSSGSNITLPFPRTGTVRNSSEAQDIGDFDLPALRKVRREKERIEAKKGSHTVTYEDAQDASNEASSSEASGFSLDSCASEGSEVAVEGGVALTEEAVRAHTPDIVEVDVAAFKNAAAILNVEVEEYNDLRTDVELQSLMTQV